MIASLQQDLAAFEAEKSKLASEDGKFAVFFDGKLVGTFASYQEALTRGYSIAGLQPFLVRQITSVPQVQHFSRTLTLDECPTM